MLKGGGKTYVAATGKVHGPVVVTVTGGRPRGVTIDVVVANGDTVAGLGAEDNVLTTNERGGAVVDPDEIGVVDGDSITTPDVLRVQVGNVNILDNNVLGTADHADTLALDDALAANTDEGLVGSDVDAEQTGLVVLDRDLGGVGLVVVAPVVLVDGGLAARGGSPGRAASLGGGALGSGEVKGAVEHDDAGTAVTEVGDELGRGLGIDGSCAATSGDALGEALGGASHGGGGLDHGRNGRGEEDGLHGLYWLACLDDERKLLGYSRMGLGGSKIQDKMQMSSLIYMHTQVYSVSYPQSTRLGPSSRWRHERLAIFFA